MSGINEVSKIRELRSFYDAKCRDEFANLHSRVEHLFVDISIGCPYALPYVATFHQAHFAPLSERAMELFLAAGYRRNGNCLYCMRCMDCSGCLPIRLHPSEFTPNRNQRRTWKKNEDLSLELVPLIGEREDVELCNKFLLARYPLRHNTGEGYYHDFFLNHIVNSARLQFRQGGRLIGTSIIDIGYNWLNAVYFYFDPDDSHRSLGTYNILRLVDICREWDIDYLYLGYLIHNVQAMKYKASFKPYYILQDGVWQPGENTASGD